MEESAVTYLNLRPTLLVKDLEKACSFYQDFLDFEVITKAPEYGLAILGKQSALLALNQNDSPTPQVIYLYVKGVETLYATCQAKKIEIYTEITTHPYGMRDFVLKDPDGHIIGIGEQIGS